MKFYRTSLADCAQARGAVVAIDVLRAFSTAGYAFAAGAETIILVSEVAEALDLRARISGSRVMGEVNGLPVPGFDFGNSPAQFDGLALAGRTLIQRTTAGTQGVVRSQEASLLLAASFCNARATAGHLLRLEVDSVTFVITGIHPGGWGDEDAACADYLEALLKAEAISLEPLLERVRNSVPGRMFSDPDSYDFPARDLEYCLEVDRFNFAMQVTREQGLNLLRPVPIQERGLGI